MNKGLELIEARWLFSMPPEKIDIVVHPESVVHSLVQYVDGSVLAQLGNPDMRTPIAHALSWPDRMTSGVADLDLIELGRLNFESPDSVNFPCLKLL
jgi:1-deoxy-D-xylulose-5-phosphate reductoisomerase